MSYSGDAAEQVVRMSLETGEVAVRLAGSGAKQLAILIYAILREQKKTAGKARLTNMLRSGKELKVFAIKDSDLQLFCREAKKYGVLYCVLKDRDATDGLTDIMARAEDASKINRIIETRAEGCHREILLVLDATTGQNAVNQARLFQEVADISGIVLTKLDGTAKGGIIVSIRNELGIPVKLVGVGEKIDDLQPFHAQVFVRALFESTEE